MLGLNNRYPVKYISGIKGRYDAKSNYLLYIERDGIKLKYPFTSEVKIRWNEISKISSEFQGEITKGLSMGKAAAGLVLAGPLGALIGAGMRSKHDNRVFFVSILYNTDGEERNLILETKDNQKLADRLNDARKK